MNLLSINIMGTKAPVGYTCNDINDIQKNIKDAIDYIKSISNSSDDDDIEYYIESASDLLNDVIEDMEDIRNDNASLRDWGDELFDKLEEAEETIASLKYKIELLEDDINELNQ